MSSAIWDSLRSVNSPNTNRLAGFVSNYTVFVRAKQVPSHSAFKSGDPCLKSVEPLDDFGYGQKHQRPTLRVGARACLKGWNVSSQDNTGCVGRIVSDGGPYPIYMAPTCRASFTLPVRGYVKSVPHCL